MRTRFKTGLALTVAISFGLARGPAFAQAVAATPGAAGEYQPAVGQAGKDVIWVPTPDELAEHMLSMARVTAKDYVVDLGSGDGRLVIMAARKFGAAALGIEFNPDLVSLSRKAAEKAGVGGTARFVAGDIFETDFSTATVVTMYLLPRLNMRLRPRLLDMAPGTRIVSHAFDMEDWRSDEVAHVAQRVAFLWIVPAKVQGDWTLVTPGAKGESERWTLAIAQSFQKLSGSARLGDRSFELGEAQMRGAGIEFSFVDGAGVTRRFNGRVAGDRMEGSTAGSAGGEGKWTATRDEG